MPTLFQEYVSLINNQTPPKGFVFLSGPKSINCSQVYFQVYLLEKLKFIMEISADSQAYYLIIQPSTSLYQKSAHELHLSSTFILTKKWISLCFDVPTFFDLRTTFLVTNFQIQSKCKIKQISEIQHNPPSITDGSFLVQRITQKRIQELIQTQMRAQSENRNDRNAKVFRKQSEDKKAK